MAWRAQRDPAYLRALVDRPPSSLGAALWRALSQTPRLLLVFFLGVVLVGFTILLWAMLDPTQPRLGGDAARFGCVFSVVTWWTALVIVEICLVGVREAAALPWPGAVPNTTGATLRLVALWLAGFFVTMIHPAIVAVLITLVLGQILCGGGLRDALRSAATARWGLRSLRYGGAISTPAKLASLSGTLGRRALRGRRDAGDQTIAIIADGVVARVGGQDGPILMIDAATHLCVVADARSDGGGYRSAGVELSSGGLPIWLFADAPDDVLHQRFAQLRSRIRMGGFLDRLYLAVFVLGGAACAAYGIALYLVAR